MRFFLFILLMLVLPKNLYAHAESPFLDRTINYDLRDQLENDPHRLVPEHERYSFAADFNIWKYWKDTNSYYHGPGYWIDTYLELNLFKDLDVNLRTIFANGTTSRGYNRSSFIKAIAGVSWSPKIFYGDWNFLMRFFDLDRNTAGAGLFLEDREMSGLMLQIDNNKYFLKLRLPGTSVIQRAGDLWSLELYRESSANRFGIHSFIVDGYWQTAPDSIDPTLTTIIQQNLSPVTSLFLASRDDQEHSTMYRAEAALSNDSWAGMAALGIQNYKNCTFCYKLYGQYRFYEDGIIDNLAGNTDYDFIPFSLHERSYQNAHNIFLVKDETQSYGINASVKFNLSKRWTFESLNEFGIFDYKTQADDDFIFSTQRFGYCPYDGFNKNCLYFYYSNKIVNASDIYQKNNAATPILYQEDVLGIYGVFYL